MKSLLSNAWRRRGLRICIYLFAAVIAAPLLFVALLQTGWGQKQFTDIINQSLKNDESEIIISEIKGSIPFNMQIPLITIADKKGIWLRLDQLRFEGSVQALLRSELLIHALHAERLQISRLPPGKVEPEQTEPLQLPEQLPAFDVSLPVINIQQLGIDDIQLGEAVIGQTMALTFQATAQTFEQQINTQIELFRTDQDNLKALLNAEILLDPLSLKLNFKVDETGGLLADLSQRKEFDDLHLQLTGQGLLSDWRAKLEGKLGGVGSLASHLHLAMDEQSSLQLETLVDLEAGLIDKELLQTIGETQQLNLKLLALDSETVRMDDLRFSNNLLNLNAQLKAQLNAQTVEGDLAIQLAQLEQLQPLLKSDLSGQAELTSQLSGTFKQPVFDLKLLLNKIRADAFQADQLSANIQLNTLKTLEDKLFDLQLNGSAKGLAQQGKALPEKDLYWDILAHTDARQQIHLKQFTLAGDWSRIKLSGLFDTQNQQGDFKLALDVDNLQAVSQTLNAQMHQQAAIKIHPQLQQIDIDLDADISRLSGLPAVAGDLLGSHIQLDSRIQVKPSQALEVRNLQLTSKALSVDAGAQLNLENSQLEAQLNLHIPELNSKDVALQQLSGLIQVSGYSHQPKISADINADRLEAAGQQLQAIVLKADAEQLAEQTTGKLSLTAKQHQQPLNLSANYALKDQQLTIDQLMFQGPETDLSGQLAMQAGLLQGKLSLNSELAALKPWTQQELSGSLNIEADLKPDKQQQTVEISGQLKQLAMQPLTIQHIQLAAKVEDALKKPHFNASLKLNNLIQQDTEINTLTANVNGVADDLRLKLATKGRHIHGFEIDLLALLVKQAEQTQIQLQNLNGKLADQTIRLKQAVRLAHSSKQTQLSPLHLTIGAAELQAQADYSEQKTVGQLQLTAPSAFLQSFVELPVSGDINARVSLSGSAEKPQLALDAQLNDIKPIGDGYDKFPASTLQLNAAVQGAQLQADLNLHNPQFTQAIQAQLKAPVAFQLQPFVFQPDETAPMSAKADINLDLAQATENIPLEGQQIKGSLLAALNVAGSIKQPDIQGHITLDNGEYQNADTETYFKDIGLKLEALPEQIKLSSLYLKDNKQGYLKGSGGLMLNQQQDHPFDAELEINHLQLADSLEMQGHLSGQLALKGNKKEALLKGMLSIDDFRYQLPSSLSQKDIPEIEVTEVREGELVVNKETEQDSNSQNNKTALKLDMVVKIPKQFYIQGHGLDSEWQGDLSIKGMAHKPEIIGMIQTKRGSLELLNNRFIFKRGLIDFNGAFPPVPSLDIETAADTDKGEAMISITGMADKPELTLSNNPALPQDEIISNLLFDDDSSNISPMQTLQLADTVSLLAQGGLSSMEALGNLRSGLGLDRLNMGGDDFETASVKAGKYVTDSIYVEIEQGLATESSTATVELDLMPEVKAEVEFSQESDSAIGIKWKYDY